MLSHEEVRQIEIDTDLLLDSMTEHAKSCDICVKHENCAEMFVLYGIYRLNTEKIDKPENFRSSSYKYE